MKIKLFQTGGEIAPEQAAPAGQDQMMQQLAQMAQEIISQLGPDGAAMLAQIIMEMLQSMPQEAGMAPQEASFYRKGGSLVMKCGGKSKKTKKASCGLKTSKKC